jgi:hypothetical protein
VGWELDPVGGLWELDIEEPPHPAKREEAASAAAPWRSSRRVKREDIGWRFGALENSKSLIGVILPF